ncbi:CinA family protein [Breoghania sp.]|uniref:CinA family protein n=1 Tax=Breoghania sp. TaxID=2065378 RepID=UPI00263834DA|nr:CinA family protein [Breoghania sp.]MDJ0930755.1 CinA family protein [Breoghania sp.]
MTDLAPLHAKAREILDNAGAAGFMVTAAESCTGGMVSAALTELAGSSAVFERGFITYSNEAKMDMLGVPAAMLKEHGAVSSVVARAMAESALLHSRADLAVSITGIAGPGGGTVDKPVGLVHFAIAGRYSGIIQFVEDFVKNFLVSDRSQIRMNAAGFALEILSNSINSLREILTRKL